MNSQKIINKIIEEKNIKNITSKEISSKTGISEKHISKIANSKAKPSLEVVTKIVEALDLELIVISKEI